MTTRNKESQKVDAAKVNAWIDEHWKGNRACPICGNTHWGIGAELVEVRDYRYGQRFNLDDEIAYPLVLVFCETCSYTMLFSAIMLGLVEKVD